MKNKKITTKKPKINNFVAKHMVKFCRAQIFKNPKYEYQRKPKHKKTGQIFGPLMF
jgi:hypothetical protein